MHPALPRRAERQTVVDALSADPDAVAGAIGGHGLFVVTCHEALAGQYVRLDAPQAALLAGLPTSVPGSTLNRLCASGLDAVVTASRAIAVGDGSIYIAGGVESMTRVPDGGFSPSPNPGLRERMPQAYMKMGETAEVVAERYGVSRLAQEELSVESHRKAAKAQELGRLHDEIVPVTTPEGEVVAWADRIAYVCHDFEDAVAAGVRGVVIVSSGFGELGAAGVSTRSLALSDA